MNAYTFPLTSHSYFTISNFAEEKARFLADQAYVPQFQYYSKHYAVETVQERRSQVTEPKHQQALDLVMASLRIQQASPSAVDVASYRACNTESFAAPERHYADAIIDRIAGSVVESTRSYWEQVAGLLQLIEKKQITTVAPEQAVFEKYSQYFQRYRQHEIAPQLPLVQLLKHYLDKTGKSNDGWIVEVREDATHARVNHQKKKVLVGRDYQPRTATAAHRIAVHEIYGHVVRGVTGSISEGEGFAVALEQLLDTRFRFRRSYRYLAVALGWGVYGKPMTFRQVHEIVWRLMVISSRYSDDAAKAHAFHECARAFRGGRPDLAVGAVYLKDAVYFRANIAVWQQLSELDVDYDEFVDMIEGRRKVGL